MRRGWMEDVPPQHMALLVLLLLQLRVGRSKVGLVPTAALGVGDLPTPPGWQEFSGAYTLGCSSLSLTTHLPKPQHTHSHGGASLRSCHPHTSQATQEKPSLKLPGVRPEGEADDRGTRHGAAEWQGPSPSISLEGGSNGGKSVGFGVRLSWAHPGGVTLDETLNLSEPLSVTSLSPCLNQVACPHSGSLCSSFPVHTWPAPHCLSLSPTPTHPPAAPLSCSQTPNSVCFPPKDPSSRCPFQTPFLPTLVQALSAFPWIRAAASTLLPHFPLPHPFMVHNHLSKAEIWSWYVSP